MGRFLAPALAGMVALLFAALAHKLHPRAPDVEKLYKC